MAKALNSPRSFAFILIALCLSACDGGNLIYNPAVYPPTPTPIPTPTPSPIPVQVTGGTMVDTFTGLSANEFATDSLGNLFVAGNTAGGGVVRMSADDGVTWNTVDTFADSGYIALTTDAANNVYVAGNNTGNCVVRKSPDHGVTWTSYDNTPIAGYTNCTTYALGVDANGSIYESSYGSGGGAPPNPGVIRQSTNAGLAWADIHTQNSFIGSSFAKDPAGNLYVGGFFQVIKSTDGGATWNPADTYAPGASSPTYALKADSIGNLYETGTDGTNWIVRMSANAGVTWTNVDTFSLDPTQGAAGYGIFVDASGNIFVAGTATDSTMVSHWIFRKSTDAGLTWTTDGDFASYGSNQFAPGAQLLGVGGGFDANGNLFVTGSNGAGSWIVRQYSTTQ